MIIDTTIWLLPTLCNVDLKQKQTMDHIILDPLSMAIMVDGCGISHVGSKIVDLLVNN